MLLFYSIYSGWCLIFKALLIKPISGLITHEYILLTDTYSQRRSALIIPGPIFFVRIYIFCAFHILALCLSILEYAMNVCNCISWRVIQQMCHTLGPLKEALNVFSPIKCYDKHLQRTAM